MKSRNVKKKTVSAKSSGGKKAAAVKTAAVVARKPESAGEQPGLYDKAILHFQAREFQKAKPLFDKAAEGPLSEMAHAARLHSRMCEARLARVEAIPESPEDRYNYAVTLINRRDLEAAETHLRSALSQEPLADHIYYALALCRGLRGDFQGASVHLKRAIELQPRNRITARNDPDFAEINRHPAVRTLLF